MKQLRVTVDKSGKTTVAVECGVVGQGCQDLTRALETALGITTDDQPTEAMYQSVDDKVDA